MMHDKYQAKIQLVNVNSIKMFLSFCFASLIFYVDIFTPRGINEAYFFVLPILFTKQISGKSSTIIISILAVILTVLGFIISPLGVVPTEISIINRLYVILGICVTSYILLQNKEKEIKMNHQNAALTKSVSDLQNANSDLEQYAYIASHDLQEPLRNITNYIGLLEKRITIINDVETSLFLNAIFKSAAKMKSLVQDILLYSLIKTDVIIKKVDCLQVVNEVLAEINGAINENQIKITILNLPVILGNQKNMKQIFQDLISNAIKFKNKTTVLDLLIQCEDKSTEWEFSVQDNGIGIEEAYFKQIFNVFQRLHSEDAYPGTGIGLATCKKIVNLSGGTIWLTSTVHIGSTFYFTIKKI
jgi:signal transduction histidine kinase